ncbi:hypothetical protein EPO33_00820 [Patescibacteria group bacterium]|nr:MAG: hypothetical protein EPO33_00820 [Patescibacteria group bacterium]
MNTYLVSYDLRKPGKDYAPLHAFLKKYSAYAKPLESLWFVKSPLTAEGVRNEIMTQIDSNDRLFVVNVTKAGAAWTGVDNANSNWIKANM